MHTVSVFSPFCWPPNWKVPQGKILLYRKLWICWPVFLFSVVFFFSEFTRITNLSWTFHTKGEEMHVCWRSVWAVSLAPLLRLLVSARRAQRHARAVDTWGKTEIKHLHQFDNRCHNSHHEEVMNRATRMKLTTMRHNQLTCFQREILLPLITLLCYRRSSPAWAPTLPG